MDQLEDNISLGAGMDKDKKNKKTESDENKIHQENVYQTQMDKLEDNISFAAGTDQIRAGADQCYLEVQTNKLDNYGMKKKYQENISFGAGMDQIGVGTDQFGTVTDQCCLGSQRDKLDNYATSRKIPSKYFFWSRNRPVWNRCTKGQA